MGILRSLAVVTVTVLLAKECLGQSELEQGELHPDAEPYTDPATNITFATWSSTPASNGWGKFSFGLVLPEDAATKDADEYIGMFRCQTLSPERTGWCGISHGISGEMVGALLLMAWPQAFPSRPTEVMTSFRWAAGYYQPEPYVPAVDSSSNSSAVPASVATVTQLHSSTNETGFQLIYRCRNCFSWTQPEVEGRVRTSVGTLVFGYAQGADGPENGGCPQQMSFSFHTNGYGHWVAEVERASKKEYATWAGKTGRKVPGDCRGGS